MPKLELPVNHWLTKTQVAEALKVSEKSVERYATHNRLQRRYVPRPGQRAMPLYNPADVERIYQELYGVTQFILPPVEVQDGPPQSRAKAAAQRARDGSSVTALATAAPMAMLAEAFLRKMSESAELARVWMPLSDATQVSGLPRWYLEQAIADARLPAHDVSRLGSAQRRWRVRRADLESLALPATSSPAKRMKAAS
ncbi:MAG: hypothetical protein SGI92_06045 [Bryobacteraceae bacterium]|nr:hypothetical protein [Bryobacteraceae bacterium]